MNQNDKKLKQNTYSSWSKMKQRCINPNNRAYKNYGGRGITYSDKFETFENFVKYMGIRPSNKHSLDRIDNNGNYTPENCRWATAKEQAYNRRNTLHIEAFGEKKRILDWTKDERCKVDSELLYRRIVIHNYNSEEAITQSKHGKYIEAFGETKSITDWVKDVRCKIDHRTLYARIYKYNFSAEKAITEPLQKQYVNNCELALRQSTYNAWKNIIERCDNPKSHNYKNYGGRNINYSNQFKTFDGFINCLGIKPSLKHSIDRIDVNSNYTPENCRWTTQKEQSYNKRGTIWIEAFGESKTLLAWEQDSRCKVGRKLLRQRIYEYDWIPEKAIVTPKQTGKLYTAWGVTKSISDWSIDCRCKIDYWVLKSRLYKGWDIKKAMVVTPQCKNKKYTAYGQTKSVKEWSRDIRCEVTYGTLSRRLKNDNNLKQAMKKKKK